MESPTARLGDHEEDRHRRCLGEARDVHDSTRARGRCRGRRSLQGQERRQARRVQGPHHRRSGRDERSRRHQTSGLGLRWRAGGPRSLRRAATLGGHGDLDDQVEGCKRVFESTTRWTVVRGSDLEEGESEGLPVWSQHVGDPLLASNRTRRVDFALFMVRALENDAFVHEAPAIVGCRSPSALAVLAAAAP